MLSLKNPIPRSIDKKEITQFFDEFGIVPYYGDSDGSSHNFLDLLQSLTSLSPSYESCLLDLNAYTFGRNVDVVGKVIPGLRNEPEELDFPQKEAFINFYGELNITLLGILKNLKKILRYLTDSGNAYVHIKRVQVGDSVKYFVKNPHYKHCAYLSGKGKEEGIDFIIISKFLGHVDQKKLMGENPPTILRATQYGEPIKWDKTGDGIEEAVIHIKNDEHNDTGDYYGRPAILSVLTWLYTDFQVGNLNAKISATEIISKKILALEAPDPRTLDDEELDEEGEGYVEITGEGKVGKKGKKEDSFEKNLRILRQIVTNLGDHGKAQSIAAVEYPYGGKEPVLMDIEINRDTKHHAWQIEAANAVICSILQWSPELTNFRQAKANIGGNVLYDLFTIKNETTIEPIQTLLQNIANYLFSAICTREGGDDDFKNYGIQLPNVIGNMIEKFKGAGKPVTSNTPPDPEQDPEED